MSFSTAIFIFAFLPFVLFVYFISPGKSKNSVLVIFSLVFYASFIAFGGIQSLILLFYSIIFNFVCGLLLDAYEKKPLLHKAILFLAILGNLIPLLYYKYFNFAVMNINYYLHLQVPQVNIALPLGISFFAFKALSYLIDVYRQKVKADRNMIDFALYLSIFTQIISGPITPYAEMKNQIKLRTATTDSFADGIHRFIKGLGKKVLIADVLGQTVDMIFAAAHSQQIDMATAWLGMICYTFQVYFDFSGYTDMAIGLGKMFGFDTMENFNFPYVSKSITEFWRRWHISLSSWFRNYLYIPLGGNRRGNVYFNLFIVFLVTGIWHGASWTFIVWGLWHGLFIIIERIIRNKSWYKQIPSVVKIMVTLFIVALGWVLFRSASFNDAITYYKLLFGILRDPLPEFTITYYLNPQILVTVVIACLLSVPLLSKITVSFENKLYWNVGRSVFMGALLVLSLMFVMNSTYNPFIYFQF